MKVSLVHRMRRAGRLSCHRAVSFQSDFEVGLAHVTQLAESRTRCGGYCPRPSHVQARGFGRNLAGFGFASVPPGAIAQRHLPGTAQGSLDVVDESKLCSKSFCRRQFLSVQQGRGIWSVHATPNRRFGISPSHPFRRAHEYAFSLSSSRKGHRSKTILVSLGSSAISSQCVPTDGAL